jgi:lauroyl/myristoyl acyltransferase
MQRYVTLEGGEHLEESFKEKKGVIMLSFHFNHPPVLAIFLGYMGYDCCGYAVHPRDLNVPLTTKVNTWLCYKGSERKGAKYAYMNRDAREVRMRILGRNGGFGALIDVAVPGRSKDLKPVRFLGEQVLIPSGITKIIYETGSPVHIAYCVRDTRDWRRARVVVLPRLPMTGDADKDMQAIVSGNEAVVLEHPEQWWGWGKFERATLAYREERRRQEEESQQQGDQAGGTTQDLTRSAWA